MTHKDVDTNKVKECLSGLAYPADKEKMIQHVKNTCGDEGVVSMIKDLPEKSYGGVNDLTRQIKSLLNVDVKLSI